MKQRLKHGAIHLAGVFVEKRVEKIDKFQLYILYEIIVVDILAHLAILRRWLPYPRFGHKYHFAVDVFLSGIAEICEAFDGGNQLHFLERQASV